MKVQSRMWAASLAVLCLSANAQDRIAGPSPSSRTTWDLFAEPGAASAARQVTVGELPLPLVIRESKASHHRIDVQGQSFWIKGAHVRLLKDSTAKCVPAVRAPVITAATPGVGKNGC